MQLYLQLGFSRERTAQQLLRGGYPTEQVRTHFPDLPATCFEAAVQTPSKTSRPPRSAQPASEFLQTLRSAEGQSGAVIKSATKARAPSPQAPVPIAQTVHAVQSKTSVQKFAPSNPKVPQAPVGDGITGEGISFQYVPLIQCSFPHSDPGGVSTFTRRNGWLELTVSTTRPELGLPYGVPVRLLTIYCASEAVRSRSPEIFLGNTVHEFLRLLDVPITRGDRGSLRTYANQLLQLIHCTLTIDENIRDANGRQGLHIRQAVFAEEARLWWDEGGGVGQGSSLVLSSVLFNSILDRSAPLSTHAIRQLRKSPMDLDVYAWLVHRLHHLAKPSLVSWPQLSGQFGHGYGTVRKFRRFFADSLKRVLEVYPQAQLKPTDAGILLLPSKPHIPRSAPTPTR